MTSQLAIFSNEIIQLCCLVRNLVQHSISQNNIFCCVPHKQTVILYYLHTPHNRDFTYGKKSSASLLPSAGFIAYENGKMHFWIKYPFKCSDREMPCCDRLAFTRACREHISHFPSSSKKAANLHVWPPKEGSLQTCLYWQLLFTYLWEGQWVSLSI